jgi:hypothetical protein
MKQIDVWWRGRDRNAELMLLLAHIIRQSRPWEGTKIRVLRWVESEEARTGTEVHIARFLEAVRVEAKPVVVVKSSPEELFDDVLRQNSRATDLVFLGLRVPEPDAMERHATQVNSLLQASKSALLVRSGETEDILDPDSVA